MMNARKYRTWLIVLALLVTIICIVVIIYTTQASKKYAVPKTDDMQYQYILREHDDRIGVFKGNEDSPFRMLNVYVQNLPIVDQYELKEGIMVQDDDKLRIIVEDYES